MDSGIKPDLTALFIAQIWKKSLYAVIQQIDFYLMKNSAIEKIKFNSPQDRLGFIDGLRALSIISVVAYHVGLPGFSGGYVGVDIFFVISGFLIINKILQDLKAERFSLGRFLAGRALRILPAYFLVIAISCIVATYVLVLPREIEQFGQEVVYSSLMTANHLFLSEQGYFDRESTLKPLLHLWSLSVEMQFYLITPLILLMSWVAAKRLRWSPHTLIGIIGIVGFVLSLKGCISLTGVGQDKNYAFYLTPFRAWEFILGGGVAALLPVGLKLPGGMRSILAAIGLLIILYAVHFFSGWNPFPSYFALLPTLGAGLVILGGLAAPASTSAQFLAIAPMRFIGRVSYAWYLWHWPLLAFGRIYNFGERSLHLDTAMGILSLILATATFYLVEKPLEKTRHSKTSRMIWGPLAVSCMACACFASIGWWQAQVLANWESIRLGTAMNPPLSPVSPTKCNTSAHDFLKLCFPDDEHFQSAGLLFGDSHALAAYNKVAVHAEENKSRLAATIFSTCVPIFDVKIFDPYSRAEKCRNIKSLLQSLLRSKQVPLKYAILISRWNIYTPWKGAPPNGHQKFLLGEPEATVPAADQKEVFVHKLRTTFEEMLHDGIERILIFAPLPEFAVYAPECVSRSKRYNLNPDERCSISRAMVDERREQTMDWLKEATQNISQIRLIDPINLYCDHVFCRSYDDRGVLFRDADHLTELGVEKLYTAFNDNFRWAFDGENNSQKTTEASDKIGFSDNGKPPAERIP